MATAMLIGNRGVSQTTKGVMKDFSRILNAVTESQFDLKKKLVLIASYMDVNECDSTIFFETTKRTERLWLATETRSIRFTILEIVSVYDLKAEVNYHKGTGHVLCFTEEFGSSEHLGMVKEMLEEVFSVDKTLPVERTLCFFVHDGNIFMRHYLVDGVSEIGPRLTLKLDKILSGCFKGEVIYNDSKASESKE